MESSLLPPAGCPGAPTPPLSTGPSACGPWQQKTAFLLYMAPHLSPPHNLAPGDITHTSHTPKSKVLAVDQTSSRLAEPTSHHPSLCHQRACPMGWGPPDDLLGSPTKLHRCILNDKKRDTCQKHPPDYRAEPAFRPTPCPCCQSHASSGGSQCMIQGTLGGFPQSPLRGSMKSDHFHNNTKTLVVISLSPCPKCTSEFSRSYTTD